MKRNRMIGVAVLAVAGPRRGSRGSGGWGMDGGYQKVDVG